MTRAEPCEALHGVAIYNPDLLSRDELKRYFVGRLPLLERILADLKRERPGRIAQHRLFLGQRGMGKTSLLRRLAVAVEEDPELEAIWLPLTFPEEQYNIAGQADLWLNCLDALGDALERRGLETAAAALDVQIQALDDASPDQVLAALLDQARQLQRRLLLLIDNIDLILDRLRDHHWALRETLQSRPEVLVFGASARAIEASYKYDAAFYDFFRIDELKGLTEAELKATLLRLAEVGNTPAVAELVEQDPARIHTLHLLTGGNPRTAVLLYGVLAQGPAGDVRSDLEGLLDRVTPLYKARVEDLPERGQQLLDALALHWDPASARQLAGRLGWDVNLVSAQLDRLHHQGIIEKTEAYKSKRTLFQIAERFFNIWYLMRASRRVRRRLIWLVRFLHQWLSASELDSHARHPFKRRGAIQIDRGGASPWNGLGVPLADPLASSAGAEQAYRRVIEIDPDDPSAYNHLAWFLYQQDRDLPEARRLAEQGRALAPEDPNLIHTLATILTRLGDWPAAAPLIQRLIDEGGEQFLADTWSDLLLLFREAVRNGQAAAARDLLDASDAGERWRPLREALAAAAEGSADYLRLVAPEVRAPARAIFDQLLDKDKGILT